MNFWAFNSSNPTLKFGEISNSSLQSISDPDLQHFLAQQSQISGISGILITNTILLLPLIWIARRWRLPFGSFTILLSLPIILMGVLDVDFKMSIIGIVSGLAADFIYKIWRVTPAIRYKNHAVFTMVPFCLFSLYFLDLQIATSGIVWIPVFWGGSIVLSMLSGLVLSAFAYSKPPKHVNMSILN
ncbi:hypothetical protein H7C19_23205 [Cohnella nanjingensis]|uniref:Uncharacterized protein n=2 Tax=Cohnella nanjingensis TaxID=1387779 RepID=A0A7X0RTV2_9BACL|nr:hypothetical protein [Cohnella nanjingensis]